MRKQPIRDEIELLQAHEEHVQGLVNLIQDGVIDLGMPDNDRHLRVITRGQKLLLTILDRAITSRNQQLKTDDDPRHERYPYEH